MIMSLSKRMSIDIELEDYLLLVGESLMSAEVLLFWYTNGFQIHFFWGGGKNRI